MDIYLPIAGQSVNALLIVALGGLVGILSGMFGVGGGFLITPLLIFYNVPPAIAVATGANQVIASSFSGALSHFSSTMAPTPPFMSVYKPMRPKSVSRGMSLALVLMPFLRR